MAKDTCLKCGKPLPANKELASVPNGRLVAFDIDANRVWRICEVCDAWNLMGTEGAKTALPELATRFASEPAAGPDGISMVVLGDRRVMLFRVGTTPSQLAAAVAASETHARIEDPASWPVYVGLALLIIVGFPLLGWLDNFPAAQAIFAVFGSRALMLGLVTYFTVRGLLSAHENWRGQPRAMRLLYVLGLPTIAIMFEDSDVSLWGGLIATTVGTIAGFWTGRREGVPRGIRWSSSRDRVTYHDGAGPPVSGRAALAYLSLELQREFDLGTKPTDREAAWALWKQHNSLASLLTALEGRRRRDGLLRLSDLTTLERMTLHIGTGARLAEPPVEVIVGLHEAADIAAIAESLDPPPGGS